MTRKESERRKQRYLESKRCPVHDYMMHGKEAEQLRSGLEEILTEWCASEAGSDACVEALLENLQQLLDDVDARDSLAYLERIDPRSSAGPEGS